MQHDVIRHQEDLLATHRQMLKILLRQQAQMGVHVTTGVQYDIASRRADITRIKAYLRQNGVNVEDYPGEEDNSVPTSQGVPTTPLPILYQVTFYNQLYFGQLIRDDPASGIRAIEVIDRQNGLSMVIQGPSILFTQVR